MIMCSNCMEEISKCQKRKDMLIMELRNLITTIALFTEYQECFTVASPSRLKHTRLRLLYALDDLHDMLDPDSDSDTSKE